MDRWLRKKIAECVEVGRCQGEIEGVTFEELLPYLIEDRPISDGDCPPGPEDPDIDELGCVIQVANYATGELTTKEILIDMDSIEHNPKIEDYEEVGYIADTVTHERLHYRWPSRTVDTENKTTREDKTEHAKVYRATTEILELIFDTDENLFETIRLEYPYPQTEYILIIPVLPFPHVLPY